MTIRENVTNLYDMILSGKLMDGFEKYYAEDVVMRENTEEPRIGKAANREAEKNFVESVEAWHGGGLKEMAVDEEKGVAMFVSWMDVTFKNGYRINMEQVNVQNWKDGQVVEERFYYNKPN